MYVLDDLNTNTKTVVEPSHAISITQIRCICYDIKRIELGVSNQLSKAQGPFYHCVLCESSLTRYVDSKSERYILIIRLRKYNIPTKQLSKLA